MIGCCLCLVHNYGGVSLSLPIPRALKFSQNVRFYLLRLLTAVVAWWLAKSRGGLKLKEVDENTQASHASGMPVILLRYLAVLFGGAMIGLGGVYPSLSYTPMWSDCRP